MESKRIENSQITASSSFDEQSTGSKSARIRTETGSGAWCPATQINASSHEWIQVDLKIETVISAIETQGRWDKGRGLEFPTGYMIEYWRDSLGRWARYRDFEGNEIIKGNSDTQSALLYVLDGCIITRLIRIIPVSETTRTVCMRFELYGCSYQEHLLNYSMLDGSNIDGLDLRDTSYDGIVSDNGYLSGGIGRLFDGVVGDDNFEKNPNGWVGWRKKEHLSNKSQYITFQFSFSSRQNFSAISFYVSNFRKLNAQVFCRAKIYFSSIVEWSRNKNEKSSQIDDFKSNQINYNNNSSIFSARLIDFDYPIDTKFETGRWVRIPIIPNRIAHSLKIKLYFADYSEWILLSEVKFKSENVPFDLPLNFDEGIDYLKNNLNNSITFFSVEDENADKNYEIQSNCFLISIVFFISIIVCIVIVFMFYCCSMFCKASTKNDFMSLKSTSPNLKQNDSKSIIQMLFTQSNAKSSKNFTKFNKFKSPIILNSKCNTHVNYLSNKNFKNSIDSSSSEYADPDFENNLAQPLLNKKQSGAHYAVGNISKDQTSMSFYDLMNRSTGSSCNGPRYRATPSASTFASALINLESFENCGTFPIHYSNNKNHLSNINNSTKNIDNGAYYDNTCDILNKINDSNRALLLPKFDVSAIHFVKTLGTSASGFGRINLFRMDADRLVTVIDYNVNLMTNSEAKAREDICHEIDSISRLHHYNILHIIGTITSKNSSWTIPKKKSLISCYITEFMPNGNLEHYLMSRRGSINNETLISFATQIAAGMAYLESCNFVHKNLAARNCLLDSDTTIKISFEEFSLREFKKTESYYYINEFGKELPIRWMAWEALVLGKFSTKSDVWSFGVTMWELFSECLEQPYANFSNLKVIQSLKEVESYLSTNKFQHALPIPNRCSHFIYEELITTCWKLDPHTRPKFSDLHRLLQNLKLTHIAPKLLNNFHSACH